MIFKQVFRIAFVTLIWKQYKAWIISTTLLLLSLYLIGQIHADVLQNWELQNDTTQTGASFIYKWLAYIGSISVYFLYHYFRPKKDSKSAQKDKQNQIKKELNELSEDEDPFKLIREKEKLSSRSDILLKQKQKS